MIFKFYYKSYLIDIWNNKKMGMGMDIRIYLLPTRMWMSQKLNTRWVWGWW